MYYTDDSLYPENMQPLIITVAPYGPSWIPGDADIPVTWKEQVQAAIDCQNAGATSVGGSRPRRKDRLAKYFGLLRKAKAQHRHRE